MGASMGGGGSRRGRRGRRGGFTEINVTPFVDVMLVLLIIFMVTAPMLTAGVEVDLPDSKASAMKNPTEPLTVSIKSNGDVYLQNTEIKLSELAPKLQAIVGEKMDTVIYVNGDGKNDYARIMQVVGEVNAAGFNKVGLLTDFDHSDRR